MTRWWNVANAKRKAPPVIVGFLQWIVVFVAKIRCNSLEWQQHRQHGKKIICQITAAMMVNVVVDEFVVVSVLVVGSSLAAQQQSVAQWRFSEVAALYYCLQLVCCCCCCCCAIRLYLDLVAYGWLVALTVGCCHIVVVIVVDILLFVGRLTCAYTYTHATIKFKLRVALW